jgi:hypothetical protein
VSASGPVVLAMRRRPAGLGPPALVLAAVELLAPGVASSATPAGPALATQDAGVIRSAGGRLRVPAVLDGTVALVARGRSGCRRRPAGRRAGRRNAAELTRVADYLKLPATAPAVARPAPYPSPSHIRGPGVHLVGRPG